MKTNLFFLRSQSCPSCGLESIISACTLLATNHGVTLEQYQIDMPYCKDRLEALNIDYDEMKSIVNINTKVILNPENGKWAIAGNSSVLTLMKGILE